MISCPYCFAKVARRRIAFRCMGKSNRMPGCDPVPDEAMGALRGDATAPVLPPVFAVRKPGRRAVCPGCSRETGWRVCPSCHSRLPAEYCANPGKIVALVGAKGAGKSTYIAVLIHELMNRVGEELDVSLVACDDRTIERYKQDFARPLYGERTLLVSTQSAEAGPRDPLVYLLTRTARGRFRSRVESLTLVLFDTAGEDLRHRDMSELHLRYLGAADAVIFLLDPLGLPGAHKALEGAARERSGALDDDLMSDPMDVITRVTELLRSKDRGPLTVPVAVALSKIDVLRPAMARQSALHRARDPIRALDLDDRDAVHEQIRGLLDEWQESRIDRYLGQQYAHYALFGLSALGAIPPDEKTVSPSGIRPYRVEDPLLWLLYRFKILDGIRR
ncbi:TRAFAC clade GTPase domain-containing protein [Streptosporangium sp. H16]|uniref:TRAFAC clade GTPase domain-containing protein n=1 Tax=Streptosporangium sp. H16 TaxID=3444184 RepID=UPI003F7A3257